MATGKIKRIVRDRGFGFIKPDDGGEDLFFHRTGIQTEPGFTFDSIEEGTRVEFEETQTAKGTRAENITRE